MASDGRTIEQRELDAHREAVMAITPRGLEDVAGRCIVAGMSFEATRKRLLEAFDARERRAPHGSRSRQPLRLQDVSDRDLHAAITGQFNYQGTQDSGSETIEERCLDEAIFYTIGASG